MSSSPDAARDPQLNELPPVEPPTAGFIVQLFVIPAVIVLVVIVVWLLFGKLAGGERGALDYVQTIRSPDANWRAAFELASLIQNDAKLAEDPVLLGELTELLDEDLKRKDVDPKLLQYLALTLGTFRTLDAKPRSNRPLTPLDVLAQALDANQPESVRMAAATSIARLASLKEGSIDSPMLSSALAKAGKADSNSLRKVATFALGFLGGASSTEALSVALSDEDRDVRYNAACALGRRDLQQALATLREMLTQSQLDQVIKAQNESEKASMIEAIQLEALHSVRVSTDAGHLELAKSLRPELDILTKSSLVKVRTEAEEILKKVPANG